MCQKRVARAAINVRNSRQIRLSPPKIAQIIWLMEVPKS